MTFSRSRIILATLGVTIVLSATAEAHHRQRVQSDAPRGTVDVAAIPAYPVEGTNSSQRLPRHLATHGRKASRMASRPTESDTANPGPSMPEIGSGIVRSRKTGATAHVSASFAAVAQAVVDDLEQNHGAVIKFMGGYRRGPCASWSLHPCGLAIDLCQLSRGVVDSRCNMPSRAVEEQVARAHGAYSGGEWCSQDRGHIQAKETASPCGHNLYAAVSTFKHRHRIRLAHR